MIPNILDRFDPGSAPARHGEETHDPNDDRSHDTRPDDHHTASAQAVLDAAIHTASTQSLNVSVAIHDAGGYLLAFSRKDGAPELTIDIAQNKSYASIAFDILTHQWQRHHSGRRAAQTRDGRPIGSIGLSGGHDTQGMAVATEVLEVCGSSA
ncbi:GlcG/HbpS family heme-binding protein [Rhodococcus sp. NPDC055112]